MRKRATIDGTVQKIPYEIDGDGNGIDYFPPVNAVISPETITSADTTVDTTDDMTTTDDLGSTTLSFSILVAILAGMVFSSEEERESQIAVIF